MNLSIAINNLNIIIVITISFFITIFMTIFPYELQCAQVEVEAL